jgi:protein-S-isoprenylcysteine O-methyltransferase Ste14
MKIALQSVGSTVFSILFFGVLLFWPAGTFDYWQAWVFIAVFVLSTAVPNLYLARVKPELMQRRIHAGPTAETRPAQRIITAAIFLSVVLLGLVSALDHRFSWSTVSTLVVIVGNILVLVGLGIAGLVLVQNDYAAATITVEADQKVVSTGLYGFVRHPMYSGALIMIIGSPLALGSYWGLLVVVPALVALSLRVTDEEKALREELDGYDEYTEKVHYRLLPGVW